jgi:tetratricopeptide (TPR) repeat protein
MEEERKALSLKGILCAEQGAFEKAHHMAEELKDSIQKGLNRKAIRYYDLVEGGIALKKVNVLEAIENFQEAISLLPFQSDFYNDHAFFMEPLARAYEKAGNLEKARAEYEKIIALTSGRLIYGDIYAEACYRLGVIAEKRGQKDKAVEHYRKFLDLWENADSGLPEVEDARKRLEGLKGT